MANVSSARGRYIFPIDLLPSNNGRTAVRKIIQLSNKYLMNVDYYTELDVDKTELTYLIDNAIYYDCDLEINFFGSGRWNYFNNVSNYFNAIFNEIKIAHNLSDLNDFTKACRLLSKDDKPPIAIKYIDYGDDHLCDSYAVAIRPSLEAKTSIKTICTLI